MVAQEVFARAGRPDLASLRQSQANRRVNTFTRWLPALLWAVLIFVLSAWTSPPKVDKVVPMADKAVHWTLFCVQSWLVASALRNGHKLTLQATLGLAILITSAYGALDEYHQRFIPNRTCDFVDWVADTLGATAAAAAYYVYESRRRQKADH